ncbi:MAG: carboxypeptidase-like regulatory domain-containing protein [Bacteroidetes bacterium]|nr:carboxypeptidase-like regulatory domain-containing protein [Bacteroidota bacterium]
MALIHADRFMWKHCFCLFLFTFCLLGAGLKAQGKYLQGEVQDRQSDEPIPFVSIYFKIDGRGTLSDSLGKFSLFMDNILPSDTLAIDAVGYELALIPVSQLKDTVYTTFKLNVQSQAEAIVKVKYDRALWFWKKIMSRKLFNDREHWQNYSYEIYNKLELDIDNINREKLENNKILKPLNFALDFMDSTSEKRPFLPVYLIETLSDYYHQNKPPRTREEIKGTITNGIDNESIMKQLGATYQNVDVYNNSIPVFDKNFVSPFSDFGDHFYSFQLMDTQYLNNKRLVHLFFTPKRKGENTFTGDAWINDTSFAIQKITLRPSSDANINFIKGLSIIQEFKLLHDSTWFLYKDKFVADIAPLGNNHIAFKGRKTATYTKVLTNSDSITQKLQENKSAEDIILLPGQQEKTNSFWEENRHEPLNKNEQSIYTLLDTLEKMPAYIHYRNTLNFLFTGTKDLGNIRIGPWYYWLSGNSWEGTRLRFDVATNEGFNKKLNLNGYVAYGFSDQKFKGKAEMKYLWSRDPWSYISLSYKNDLDNGVVYYDQLGTDNLFGLFLRKPGVPSKFQNIEEKKFEFYKENEHGFGFGLTAISKKYTPLQNLPGKDLFPSQDGESLNDFETILRIRYAFNERTLIDNFSRTSLGSDLPIIELKYTHGFKNVLNSSYTYNKIDFSVSDYLNLSPYGNMYYNIYAGKIFGTLPYNLLDILPGNEWYYYSRYSFNLMNRFEYLTDEYAGINIEHNIGSGIFKFIPITRKLKLRQFWEAKAIIGNLSNENKQLNLIQNFPFQSLDGKPYLEIGTGVDNILKFFRVDFLWRLLPQPLPSVNSQRFGVFFGFRLSL